MSSSYSKVGPSARPGGRPMGYIDALPIPQTDKRRVSEGNARRVFPRLDAILKERGR